MLVPFRRVSIGCLALLVLAMVASRSAAQYATPVALRGQFAPDTGGNAFFIGFGRPSLNAVGQVAFLGLMPGTGQGGDRVGGIFLTRRPAGGSVTGNPPELTGSVHQGTVTQIALFAGPAPGNPQPIVETDPNNPLLVHEVFFSSFGDQIPFNSGGAVAYQGVTATRNLFSGAVIRLRGIFAGTDPTEPGAVPGPQPHRMVALERTAGPTLNTPGPTASIWDSLETNPAQNDEGRVAFHGFLNINNGQNGIFYRDRNASVFVDVALTQFTYTVNLPGSPTPITITFDGFGDVHEPSLNNAGSIAFYATTNNPAAPAGIFRWDSGNLTAVALENQVAQGTGGNYRSIQQTVSISEAGGGLVAFKATLTTGPGAGDTGIFAQPSAGAAAVKVAQTRDNIAGVLTGYSAIYPAGVYPADHPSAGSPVSYVEFFSDIAQNRAGWLAFGASLSPGDGGGVFLASPGNYAITAAALSGNPAPGAGPGVRYASFRGTPLALNAHNGVGGLPEVSFVASLAGTGVDGSNDIALFIANGRATVTDPLKRETALLARSGDPLTIAPGITKTIQDFGATTTPGFYTSVGKGRDSINDNGQVATLVNFTDGTQGIYVFSPDMRLRDSVVGPAATITWDAVNGPWTFGYAPNAEIYRTIIDPADGAQTPVAQRLTEITVTGAAGSVPGLRVGGQIGRAHLVTAGDLAIGTARITDGSDVLTIQTGTLPPGFVPLGVSDITGAGIITLNGDVRSRAGAAVAAITNPINLRNVGFPALPTPTPTPPPAPPLNPDILVLRTVTVERGNFVGTNPIDLVLSGIISGNRGIIKAGDGTLVLSGINTFGPDDTITDRFAEAIRVTGGTLSISADRNLGAVPLAPPPPPPPDPPFLPRPRWIVLNGGALQATATFAIDPNRGISLGPITGSGNGTIDVTGVNVLTYGGIIADNTDEVISENGTVLGTTTGVGSLTKTGTGTLILTNPANTYRGGTTVNRGALVIAGDGSLGLGGTPVVIDLPGRLTYTGSSTTSRPFTFNNGGGVLSVTGGNTLNFNSTTVDGGTLSGPGLFTTVLGGSSVFTGNTTSPSATLTLRGADLLFDFNNGGQLNVASTPAIPTFTRLTNQTAGSITVAAGNQVNVSDFQTMGVVSLNPNTQAVPTQLNNTGLTPLFFGGGSRTFIGTPATAAQFAAGIDLRGQNAIVAGGLLVNNGFIIDTAPGAPGRVIADYGGRVKGAGFFQNPVITQNGGVFQIGNSPGSASFGKFQFGPGGTENFRWQINNALGDAGPIVDATGYLNGWSVVRTVQQLGSFTFSGDFDWTATPASKLTFALETLLGPTMVGTDVAGPMSTFDPTQSYSWPVVQYAGSFQGPASNAALDASTLFDTSAFQNAFPGYFAWNHDTAGHMLSLVYNPTPVPEPGTLALVGAAAAAGWWRWRRRKV